MHSGKYILIILFVVIISLPALNSLMGVWEFERKDENRAFKNSVNLSIENIDAIPAEAEAYLNDNFSFRSPLLDLYHYIKFHIAKVSPHREKTVIGRDNWYFMAGKDKEIYEGNHNFSFAELEAMESEWQHRKHYFDSLDIAYYWLICPIKYHIYPEKLPFTVSHRNEIKLVDQLKTHLAKKFPKLIIDPTEKLREAKAHEKLFYQLDNHWNYRAGLIASEKLLSTIKADFPNAPIGDITPFEWKDTVLHSGHHHRVLGIESLSEQEKWPLLNNQVSVNAEKYGFPVIKGFPYKWQYERRFVNKRDTTGLRLLVIRDSFGKQLMPFIKEAFSETVYIFDSWQYGVNKEIIETVKPDIIVYMSVEAYIDHFLTEYE